MLEGFLGGGGLKSLSHVKNLIFRTIVSRWRVISKVLMQPGLLFKKCHSVCREKNGFERGDTRVWGPLGGHLRHSGHN